MYKKGLILCLVVFLLVITSAFSPSQGKGGGSQSKNIDHEIWVADQKNNEIYIINGRNLHIEQTLTTKDGVGKKPHMLVFDNNGDYAYVANMESGDVSVIRAKDRKIVDTIPTAPGAHAAVPTNKRDKVIVANTPSQSLSVITTDVANEHFSLERTVSLHDYQELSNREEFPNLNPICLYFTADDSSFYVTIGGGGLVVFNTETLEIEKAYTKNEVIANGCGLILAPDQQHMYANAGNVTKGEYYLFDTNTHQLIETKDSQGYDAHGVDITPDGKYLWVVNRHSNDASIVDISTNEVVSKVEYVGDSPDLIRFSPNGQWAYITTRGPEPATGTHDLSGQRPGVSIINTKSLKKVKQISFPGADMHAIDVRGR
ncbi:YncE family protein [Bacillus alkalicellulosilyticus]|uniref:YncE family protein n=1 Tax=Alkalihalobacterium alkalicellulosilyticum TaxID=1912214 RepID=UPI000997E79C|nr:YncE family protein [Bacillus alkalicellulosilyticus]